MLKIRNYVLMKDADIRMLASFMAQDKQYVKKTPDGLQVIGWINGRPVFELDKVALNALTNDLTAFLQQEVEYYKNLLDEVTGGLEL